MFLRISKYITRKKNLSSSESKACVRFKEKEKVSETVTYVMACLFMYMHFQEKFQLLKRIFLMTNKTLYFFP